MKRQEKTASAAREPGNGWVSCGIPANDQAYGDFWTLWAASRDSRKCPCGCLVISGPCPECGREYSAGEQG